jgi:HTH-type transcriptional regulator/antitoxin HigA
VNIRPIRTEADYQDALGDIAALMASDPAPDTPKGDRLDILATLVQAYEARHFPIDAPDPVEAIKFRMEQSGLTVKDLEPFIGRANRVDEMLNRTRIQGPSRISMAAACTKGSRKGLAASRSSTAGAIQTWIRRFMERPGAGHSRRRAARGRPGIR